MPESSFINLLLLKFMSSLQHISTCADAGQDALQRTGQLFNLENGCYPVGRRDREKNTLIK